MSVRLRNTEFGSLSKLLISIGKTTLLNGFDLVVVPPVLSPAFIMAEEPDLPPPITLSFTEVEMAEQPNEYDEGKENSSLKYFRPIG